VVKLGSLEFGEPLVFLLSFFLVLFYLFLVCGYSRQNFALSLQELLFFPIKLGGFGNDVFLLLCETLIDFSLFALLL